MPIEFTPCPQRIANDEVIRRIDAIRNEQTSEKQSQFQFVAFDSEAQYLSLHTEFCLQWFRSFRYLNHNLPVLLNSIERLSNDARDPSHILKRRKYWLVNHDRIVIGSLNGVAILSEDSQRLLPDLPSRI
jgi:hypothetical protein